MSSTTIRRNKQINAWFNIINCLDPFIHRILFNYVKALELFESHFYEEAITALDKTVNVAEQFIRKRLKLTGKNQRDILITTLELNLAEKTILKQLYELRCYFGGHPSMSKWWDFFELYENTIDRMKITVKKVIFKICSLEKDNRLVDDNPLKWSDWFKSNAMMLWNSVCLINCHFSESEHHFLRMFVYLI